MGTTDPNCYTTIYYPAKYINKESATASARDEQEAGEQPAVGEPIMLNPHELMVSTDIIASPYIVEFEQ